jgi:hypothetical protein
MGRALLEAPDWKNTLEPSPPPALLLLALLPLGLVPGMRNAMPPAAPTPNPAPATVPAPPPVPTATGGCTCGVGRAAGMLGAPWGLDTDSPHLDRNNTCWGVRTGVGWGPDSRPLTSSPTRRLFSSLGSNMFQPSEVTSGSRSLSSTDTTDSPPVDCAPMEYPAWDRSMWATRDRARCRGCIADPTLLRVPEALKVPPPEDGCWELSLVLSDASSLEVVGRWGGGEVGRWGGGLGGHKNARCRRKGTGKQVHKPPCKP